MEHLSTLATTPTIRAKGWTRPCSWALLAVSGSSSQSKPGNVQVQRLPLQSRLKDDSAAAVSAPNLTILLVEDNPGDATLVRTALQEHGVRGELVVATDGETAIRFIEDLAANQLECPHLAIIDLNLPRRPGGDVVGALRASRACSHIPVAILSSSDVPADRADAARLGADRYLRKPLRLDEFLALGGIFRAMAIRASQ